MHQSIIRRKRLTDERVEFVNAPVANDAAGVDLQFVATDASSRDPHLTSTDGHLSCRRLLVEGRKRCRDGDLFSIRGRLDVINDDFAAIGQHDQPPPLDDRRNADVTRQPKQRLRNSELFARFVDTQNMNIGVVAASILDHENVSQQRYRRNGDRSFLMTNVKAFQA